MVWPPGRPLAGPPSSPLPGRACPRLGLVRAPGPRAPDHGAVALERGRDAPGVEAVLSADLDQAAAVLGVGHVDLAAGGGAAFAGASLCATCMCGCVVGCVCVCVLCVCVCGVCVSNFSRQPQNPNAASKWSKVATKITMSACAHAHDEAAKAQARTRAHLVWEGRLARVHAAALEAGDHPGWGGAKKNGLRSA
jgi:hypothetical protein